MFDIGFAELLIVGVVALVVLGPEKLPVAARTVGLWLGKIRRTVGSIQAEISEELRVDEMKRTAAVSKETLDQELSDMRTPFQNVLGDESPFGGEQPVQNETVVTTPKDLAETETPSNDASGNSVASSRD